jgi:hypothetical protein
MSGRLVYLAAAAAVVACATTNPNARPAGQSQAVLTAEDIQHAHADVTNAYDAVARLRPNWLAAKGVTSGLYNANTEYATVFLDGQAYGELASLRNIAAYNVSMIRYYDVTQAGARFGIRGGASGVIEVQTKGAGQ